MKKRYLIDVQFSTDKKLATMQYSQTLQNSDEKQYCQYWILRLVVFTRFCENRDCLLKLYMSVKSARTISCELYWEKCVYIGITSCGYLSVLRQYFATMQILSSCGLPSDDGIEQGFSNYGNGNGLLFHMTQPTSRSTMKAIACSKPTISEN